MEKWYPDPFLKNQSFIQFTFIVWKDEGSQNILKLSSRPRAFTSYKAFFNKRGLELVYLPQFMHNFWRKIFLLLYAINVPNFIVWLPLFWEIFGNKWVVIVFWLCYDVINLKTNPIFLIKPVFLHDQKVKTKI